jgi:hypothetical protein
MNFHFHLNIRFLIKAEAKRNDGNVHNNIVYTHKLLYKNRISFNIDFYYRLSLRLLPLHFFLFTESTVVIFKQEALSVTLK